MLQDAITTENKYKLFLERVVATKIVWGLKNKEGWANSYSVEDEEVDVIPFWSDRAYAKACAKDDWRDHTAAEIPLAEFLENWCTGMANDNILVGTNWDANMFGKEVNALELAVEILGRLRSIQSAIKFSDHTSIDEFMAAISDNADNN